MPKNNFEPVVLEDPKDRRLRPLFVGRIADLLDSIVGLASSLFFVVFVIGGISLLGYHLYSIAVVLASRGSWLVLALEVVLVLAVALYIWISSFIKRLIAVSALALFSQVVSPYVERFFS